TRLARRDDVPTIRAKSFDEQVRLRRLARSVNAFEGEEHRGRTIRRVRAVVTGGAGFIGSNVVHPLLTRGAAGRRPDGLSSGRRDNVADGARLHEGDIRRGAESLFGEVRPDVCFHLAAQIDVRVSVEHPDVDADVNVLGTVRVLEAARGYGTKLVFSSTGGAI